MSAECEGFICPYCLVAFGTTANLQHHFMDMHSGQGQMDDYDVVEFVEEEESSGVSAVKNPLGHQFKTTLQSRPKSCDACSDIIWHDALVCQVCQVTVHLETCQEKLTTKCSDGVFDSPSPVENEPSRQLHVPPGQNPRGILPLVRRQVARGRDRYVNDEFDLDLTYITERIIAMSFPASGVESAYRNNLKDVAKMLKTKHQENYMVFNLSERSYDISRFNNQVLDFGWPDHLAPSLERLSSVCKSMRSWLDSDPIHVAVVHCKGGKGRTGCVIAAFMHYSEICDSAAAALDRFAMKRFYDNKLGGVTQPSQRKYVHYFADFLAGKIDIYSQPVALHHILLHGIPNFDGKGGSRVFFKVYENMKLVHTSGLYVCGPDRERVKMSIYGGLKLQGEVLVKCFHKKVRTGMDSIFRCQFPSAVIGEDLRLVYIKSELDDAFKDKRFAEDIKVELLFGQLTDSSEEEGSPVPLPADVRSSLLDKPPQINGYTDLSQDQMANRDSYIAFPGGYDNGAPDQEVPDLMGHHSPDMSNSNRDRSESSTSFQMDPQDIERVQHRSDIYTVVSKPFKQSERKSNIKHSQSAVDCIDGASMSHHRSVQGSKFRRNKDLSPSDAPSLPPPMRPPPPPHALAFRKHKSADLVRKDPTSLARSAESVHAPPPSVPAPHPPPHPPPSVPAPHPPTKYFIPKNEDYEDIDESSPSSSEGNSPLHRPSGGVPLQIKQTSQFKSTHQQQDRIDLSNQKHPLLILNTKGSQPPTRAPVPAPARSPGDRDNRKKELHQKYSKIREEYLKKQGGASNVSSKGNSEAGVSNAPSRGNIEGGVLSKGNVQGKKPVKPKPPPAYKLRHRPSYTEVEPDLEIRVEPISLRVSQAEGDNIWMRVKYPTMPKKGDSVSTRRSSDSSNQASSDYYSNLAELQLDVQLNSEGSGSESLGRRRHSFSEGDDKLIIRASTASRESIIDINTRTLSDNQLDDIVSATNPDYKNIHYNSDGVLSMEPEDGDILSPSFNDQIRMLGNIPAVSGGAPVTGYENTRVVVGGDVPGYNNDDYMNDTAEGWEHTYSNHNDLLMQMQADNQPLPEESEKATPLETSQRSRLGSGASILKFLKNNILKPKPPTEIHSTGLETERDRTLAPFAISGVEIGRVNRDYEAFFKTSAWGGGDVGGRAPKPASSSSNDASPSTNNGAVSVPVREEQRQNGSKRQPDNVKLKPEKTTRPSIHLPAKPRSKTSSDSVLVEEVPSIKVNPLHSPQPQRKHGPSPPPKRPPMLPPSGAQRHGTEHGPHPRSNHHPPSNKPPLPSSPNAPPSSSPPLPQVRRHTKLQASISDAPALPKARVRETDNRSQSINRAKRSYPPRPPVPFHQTHSTDSHPTEALIKSLMPHWYKPKISREEAIELVHPMSTGSFIVRDSTTVKGGYALTLKISDAMVRHRKKMNQEDRVTDDMLVTHFLIQPDPVGVKLQGWSEKPFKSLPEFIASHVADKMCLPCKLVLPEGGGAMLRRQPSGVAMAMQSGACCDLVYVGSVDVGTPGTDSLLSQTVQQLQSLDLSTMNIVTITVSREGVTLQENVNGSLLKRQYPFGMITYCGLDPVTRWNFPSLHHLGETISLTDKICFGIVHRPQGSFGYSCMVFTEYNTSQPVSSVVNFISKMMREHKHSSRYNGKN